MSKAEGRPDNYTRNATYFSLEDSLSDTEWRKVEFVDHNGEPFECGHIRLENVGAGAAYFSFDPRDVSDAERVIQGDVSNNVVELFYKRATCIYLMERTAAPTIAVQAWR